MPEEITPVMDESVIDKAQNSASTSNVQIGADNNLETSNTSIEATKNEQSCGFWIEKPMLPNFLVMSKNIKFFGLILGTQLNRSSVNGMQNLCTGLV